MTLRPEHPRLIILANHNKPLVTESLGGVRPWLESRAKIVAEPDITRLTPDVAATLPPADLALILGGDGTLLAQARLLADLGIPVLGVNFGKLGFLAEFSLDDLRRHWDLIVSGQCRTSRRMLLDVTVHEVPSEGCAESPERWPAAKFESIAVNDAVITAGPPFRMIELEITIDPGPRQASAATFTGDGVIVSTPSGSTAYNLAAGGSIVSPDVDAMGITPICPHTLALRPIVVKADAGICLRVHRANEGTTLVIDGQIPQRLQSGEQVFIRRHERALLLVHNPDLSYWEMLARKLHWAVRPRGR